MFYAKRQKVTSGVLFLLMMLQSFPGVALGYDVWGGIKNYVSSQVKVSDGIIEKNKTKITNSLKAGSGLLEQKKLEHVSSLENLVGQNKLYQMQKKASLFVVGLEAGVLNGLGNLGVEFYSLGAKIPTAPERVINFGFNYRENPQKYHQMVTNGALTVAGVLANPLTLLKQGKDAYLGAAKDPLKFGKINGEGAALVGSLFLGGTQLEALTSAGKAQKVAEANKISKLSTLSCSSAASSSVASTFASFSSSLKSMGSGLSNLLSGERATLCFAKVQPQKLTQKSAEIAEMTETSYHKILQGHYVPWRASLKPGERRNINNLIIGRYETLQHSIRELDTALKRVKTPVGGIFYDVEKITENEWLAFNLIKREITQGGLKEQVVRYRNKDYGVYSVFSPKELDLTPKVVSAIYVPEGIKAGYVDGKLLVPRGMIKSITDSKIDEATNTIIMFQQAEVPTKMQMYKQTLQDIVSRITGK